MVSVNLKATLTEPAAIGTPQQGATKILVTDASSYGMVAMLLQGEVSGSEEPPT